VREVQLVRQLDLATPADAEAGRGPLPHSVQRQDRRLFERRGVKGAGRVRFVVLGKDDALGVLPVQAVADQPRQVELLAQPQRHGLVEGTETGRREAEISLEQPLELEKRLVVEADEVQSGRVDPRLGQAVVDGVLRKRVVVLYAREALFLGRGHDAAVHEQRRRRVVVVG
jgi:hypothetical protein